MLEPTPYNIFRYFFNLDPKIIKIFIRFLIKHNIYEPYVGRLAGKKIIIDNNSIILKVNCISAKNIIQSSFTWYPPEGFYKRNGGEYVIKHFNNMLPHLWHDYHKSWNKLYKSIKDQI